MSLQRSMVVLFFIVVCTAVVLGEPLRKWHDLPQLPGNITPGAVAVSGGALIAIGGGDLVMDIDYAYFRLYSNAIYRLDTPDGPWRAYAEIPGSNFVYGHAVSTPKGLFVLGRTERTQQAPLGCAYLISFVNEKCSVVSLPEPPFWRSGKPAAIGSSVFVLGYSDDHVERFSQIALASTTPIWSNQIVPTYGPPIPRNLVAIGNEFFDIIPGNQSQFRVVQFDPNHLTWSDRSVTDVIHANPTISCTSQVGNGLLLSVGRPMILYEVKSNTWSRFESNPFTDNSPADALLWGDNIVVIGGNIGAPRMVTTPLRAESGISTSTPVRITPVSVAPPIPKKRFSLAGYIALFGYFAVTAGIGFHFSRRNSGTDDYFLGGRRVPWWAVGLSIYGTAVSSITYLAIPGAAYATNWVTILANTGILFVAPLVTWFYIPRYRAQPIATAYEFLELRFNLATRIYGSAVFVLYQVGRISVVLFLPSLALSAATGLNVYMSIVLMGLVTTLYTMTGGIEAVIWTDVMQSIVLIGGAVLALIIITLNLDGGVAAAMTTAWDAGKFHTFNLSWDITTMSLWVCLVGNAFSTMYPMTADQCVVQRYLTTATDQQARKAVWTNALLSIPTSFMFFGIGTALWVFYRQHPERVDPALPSDAVLPMFVVDRFPAGLGGLLIAGIFAAAMSTLSSSMNSVATVLSRDYYRRWRPEASDRSEMRFARGITLLFGLGGTVIAIVMATLHIPSLFEQWLKILNLVGGGLGGVMALGIFTTRANGRGAVAGAVLSTLVVFLIQHYTPIHYFMYATFGFLAAFLGGYAVSLILPVKGRD